MKITSFLILIPGLLAFAGEPTLVNGKAVSLRVRQFESWGTLDSSTALVKEVSDNYDDNYDIFNMNSESADFLVKEVWPKSANFKLSFVFVWPFVCDLVRTNTLSKGNIVAGPCGAGWQLDTVSTIEHKSSLNVWTTLRTTHLQDSIAERKGRMSTRSAWIHFTLENADSVDLVVANWKTDKVNLAVPESSALPDYLSLQNECGTELKVVSSEIPTSIQKQHGTRSNRRPFLEWESNGAMITAAFGSRQLDIKGRSCNLR